MKTIGADDLVSRDDVVQVGTTAHAEADAEVRIVVRFAPVETIQFRLMRDG